MKIGIPGTVEDDRFGVNVNYMEFASNAGDPVILSPDFNPGDIDGIILPGGADVLSSRYGKPDYYSEKPNQFLEYFDKKYLPHLLGKMPIFGICRGLQTINVVLGGTLTQHLWYHPYSIGDSDACHDVVFKDGSKMGVNSFHHQAIQELGKGITVEAKSVGKLDKCIEAISGELLFATQWHPERLLDDYSIGKLKAIFG